MSGQNFPLSGPLEFMGCYVRNVSIKLGFGSNPSSMNVTLIEDDATNKEFDPPRLGEFVSLEIGPNSRFSGIFTSYEDNFKANERTISVTVNDCREVMRAVPCVLAPGAENIASQVNNTDNHYVLDIFNRFKHPDFNVNISQWNNAGFLFNRIVQGIAGGTHGVTGNKVIYSDGTELEMPPAKVKFRGNTYKINLDEVRPLITGGHRLNTNFVSLAEIMQALAKEGAFDWHVESSKQDNGVIEITVKTIDRSTNNTDIDLQDFIDDLGDDIISNASSGIELNTDTSAVVIQGAKTERLASVEIEGMSLEPIDLSDEGGATQYLPDETEMRAALIDRMTWETWVMMPTQNGGGGGFSRYNQSTDDDFMSFVNVDSAEGSLTDDMLRAAAGNLSKINEILNSQAMSRNDRDLSYFSSEEFEKVGKIFEKIQSYASSNYGKRFVIDTPFDDIIDEAWFGTTTIGNARANRFFSESAGKARAYVQFGDSDTGDFTGGIGDLKNSFGGQFGNVFPGQAGFQGNTSAFVPELGNTPFDINNTKIPLQRTEYLVHEGALFIGCTPDKKNTITIPAAITEKKVERKNQLVGLFLNFMNDAVKNADEKIEDADGNKPTRREFFYRQFLMWFNNVPLEKLFPRAWLPSKAFIPTRSAYQRYGPFFSSNIDSAKGKIELIQDDGFAPWEFGTFQAMSDAAQAKADAAASTQDDAQRGKIVAAGLPTRNIGDIVGRNSNISDISISFSAQGIKTTYSLRSFTKKFGEFRREDFISLSDLAIRGGGNIPSRDMIRFVNRGEPKNNSKVSLAGFEVGGGGGGSKTSQTHGPTEGGGQQTHDKIEKITGGAVSDSTTGQVGMQFGSPDPDEASNDNTPTEGAPITVLGQDPRSITEDESDANYIANYGISNDGFLGLFNKEQSDNKNSVKYNDDVYKDSIQTYKNADIYDLVGTKNVPQVGYVNSYKTVEEASQATKHDPATVRGMGLRAPQIMVGWGRDIAGLTTDTDANKDKRDVTDNHKLDRSNWKSGPIDLRWDPNRGVWSAYNDLIADHENAIQDGSVNKSMGTFVHSSNPDTTQGFPWLRGRLEDVWWVRRTDNGASDGKSTNDTSAEVLTHLDHKWYDSRTDGIGNMCSIFTVPATGACHTLKDEVSVGKDTTRVSDRVDLLAGVHFAFPQPGQFNEATAWAQRLYKKNTNDHTQAWPKDGPLAFNTFTLGQRNIFTTDLGIMKDWDPVNNTDRIFNLIGDDYENSSVLLHGDIHWVSDVNSSDCTCGAWKPRIAFDVCAVLECAGVISNLVEMRQRLDAIADDIQNLAGTVNTVHGTNHSSSTLGIAWPLLCGIGSDHDELERITKNKKDDMFTSSANYTFAVPEVWLDEDARRTLEDCSEVINPSLTTWSPKYQVPCIEEIIFDTDN